MKVYATEAIRNLAVIGHGDAGKTQLVSSLLYVAGATPRWGKVDEGTTTTDHDEDSIARKITLNTALAHLEHREIKVNLIDTPGYAAFVSHARPAVPRRRLRHRRGGRRQRRRSADGKGLGLCE